MNSSLRSITLSISGLLAFFPTMGFAQNQPVSFEPTQVFPLVPRITALGMAGDAEVVWGDGMVPFWGNPNEVAYIDAQGKTAFESSWVGSLGIGFRSVYQDESIIGAYVFVDRNISENDNEFWFVSPGIEALSNTWDFRANGYIPTSSKQKSAGTGFASSFGDSEFVVEEGHTESDVLVSQTEEVDWGADAEIGHTVPVVPGLRAYVGGYHFQVQNSDAINGLAGRLELPFNRYLGLTVRDSYDNQQHNTIEAGVKITLGGVNLHPTHFNQPIQERILDPIERNLATLGEGTAEPVTALLTPISGETPERNNIWYFSPSASGNFDNTINTCTAEAPCINTNFTQATVDGINTLVAMSDDINTNILSTSPSFYLAPGAYTLTVGDPLRLNNDWIWGRSNDFTTSQLAATLTGGLTISGNNNRLNTIILQSDGIQNLGILLNPNGFLSIEGSKIGTEIASTSYHTAIEATSADLQISAFNGLASQITAYGNDGQPVTAILGTSSILGIADSNVLANSEITSGTTVAAINQNVTALNVIAAPLVQIIGSNIKATAHLYGDQNFDNSSMATGIYINNSQLTVSNSTVDAEAEVTGTNHGYDLASAIGANSFNEAGLPFQNNTITISNGSFITASALVHGDNIGGMNAAAGIGENVINTSGTSPLFSNNIFKINTASQINSTANVLGNNFGYINGTVTINANNLATGIGSNALDANNAMVFNNQFTLNDVTLMSLVKVGIVNQGVSASGVNLAAGIGGNASSTKMTHGITNASFTGNSIIIQDSTIAAMNDIGQDNGDIFSLNYTTGVGGNAYLGDATFNSNTITLTAAVINASSTVEHDDMGMNLSTAIGGNAKGENTGIALKSGDASFNTNSLNVLNSQLTALSLIKGFSWFDNLATGIGSNADQGGQADFTGNIITVTSSTLKGEADEGTNLFFNSSNAGAGFGSNVSSMSSQANFTANNIMISQGTLIGSATSGPNYVLNMATGFGSNAFYKGVANFDNNVQIKIMNSTLTATASLTADNVGSNLAAGFGSNSGGMGPNGTANFDNNSLISLTANTLAATASITGNNLTTAFSVPINQASGFGSNSDGSTANASFNNNAQITLSGVGSIANITATTMITGDNSAIDNANGLNIFTTATQNVTSDDNIVLAQLLIAGAPGSAQNIGANAGTGVSIVMTGGSITTSPSTGLCTQGNVNTLGVPFKNCS